MARPLRIEFPGAFYHVIVRGNQKQTIFLDEKDRLKYLDLLGQYKKRHGFILYAYILMMNHVHLLIETPKSALSKVMQAINQSYTSYFNRKYNKVGHLFQGRYKSYLCDRDAYLVSLARYIHLNPVRAKLVKKPHEYKWSSYLAYFGKDNGIVSTDKVLRLFSEKQSYARRLYRNFVEQATGVEQDESLYKAAGQQILGGDRFIEKVEDVVETLSKPLKRPSLSKILLEVSKAVGVSRKDIISRVRNRNTMFARHIMVGVCREVGYRLVDLVLELRRDLSVLSRWSKASENTKEQRIIRKVLTHLNARLQA